MTPKKNILPKDKTSQVNLSLFYPYFRGKYSDELISLVPFKQFIPTDSYFAKYISERMFPHHYSLYKSTVNHYGLSRTAFANLLLGVTLGSHTVVITRKSFKIHSYVDVSYFRHYSAFKSQQSSYI